MLYINARLKLMACSFISFVTMAMSLVWNAADKDGINCFRVYSFEQESFYELSLCYLMTMGLSKDIRCCV